MRAAFSQSCGPDRLRSESNLTVTVEQSETAMLSPKTQYNLKNAKTYFSEHLAVGDYYSETKRVIGRWIGNGAASLGLHGAVQAEAFLALCNNRHPESGERLTQRTKTTRRKRDEHGEEHEVANRRVFFDFTFSPPKSVSIAALVGEDDRILAAHHEAVKVAMAELEKLAATRVHDGRKISDRVTGNFVAALFTHETSRALDPHLHTHGIIFNATRDPVERRWKALQNHEMLAARKFVENVYYHQLAQSLRAFGYSIVNSARGDFELAGIPFAWIERFSKRHEEIEQKTQAFLAQNPGEHDVAAIREHIAHKDRQAKVSDLASGHLRKLWRSQMTQAEQRQLKARLHAPDDESSTAMSAAEALDWAEDHLFDRRSVVHEFELWRHALEHGRGSAITLDELKAETACRPYLRETSETSGKLTREDVLAREWSIVQKAKDGAGRHEPLAPAGLASSDRLSADQEQAFRRLLTSRNFITVFRGGAGTGKSHVLRRVEKAIGQAGCQACVIAPQRQQVIDLARDGFDRPQTVAEFLERSEIAKGTIVIVDEAGQIGGKQMFALINLVESREGRLILSGDTRQHGPVEASDALRAIERYSGLQPIELKEIRRQDPGRGRSRTECSRIAAYREAVKEASDGNTVHSFDILNGLGLVSECSSQDEKAQLIQSYLEYARQGDSALIVSQTWSHIHEINRDIRKALAAQGALSGSEVTITALERIDLTSAQKREARFHPKDGTIVFVRNIRGFAPGQTAKLIAAIPGGIVVENHERVEVLKAEHMDAIAVCEPREIQLRCGDRLQLKANGKSSDGRRLTNGEIATVAAIRSSGEIQLEDGRILPAYYRQFVHGYAVTSYSSQGKTVDHVIFADSAVKAATSAEQWYVTISRGRKSIRLLTPNKGDLRTHILRTSHRELALDLQPASKKPHPWYVFQGLRRGREFARRVCLITAARLGMSRAIKKGVNV
jgi:conjugative relaxase-like TrwC/TraI family protein